MVLFIPLMSSDPKDKSKSKQKEYLFEKAIGFFHKYEKHLDQIRMLLDIRLSQLALAYTTEYKLPCESVGIKTRVKTLDSFLKKLNQLELDDFHFPDNIVYDLIGARVTCWFLDDCKGMADHILNSNFIIVKPDGIFNYIEHPKPSGYRAIHLHGQISYENMVSDNGLVQLVSERVTCEIQVRTKLMDTWADLTHEFHYKAKEMGIEDAQLEMVLAAQAKRFFTEDESFVAIRDIYQRMVGKSE
jgi:putative GTP pyrophosphokinase